MKRRILSQSKEARKRIRQNEFLDRVEKGRERERERKRKRERERASERGRLNSIVA